MTEMNRVKYAITNLLTEDTLVGTSTESDVYLMEYLYNRRPSKPFRFTGVGSVGSPEWICVEFDKPTMVSLVALFNHNFSMFQVSGDELKLSTSILEVPKLERGNFENLHHITKIRQRAYRIDLIDQDNADAYGEIGELFVGNWEKFNNKCYLQPGRADSPRFFTGDQRTYMGQDWLYYYSEAKEFTLGFVNLSPYDEMNELEVFLKRVKSNGGNFVIIPDSDTPFVYYCKIEGDDKFGQRMVYSHLGEQKHWTISLKTLTTGVKLI
jgi:hypothetical protein